MICCDQDVILKIFKHVVLFQLVPDNATVLTTQYKVSALRQGLFAYSVSCSIRDVHHPKYPVLRQWGEWIQSAPASLILVYCTLE